ncbi:helix-turn-helix domain-containing protein [Streptomyces sp. NPDC002587]
MGRSENPVDYSVPERGRLASQLRQCRVAAELTYEQLSLRSGLSSATLKRAAAGRKTPTEVTVVRYVKACGGSDLEIAAAKAYWRRARAAERGFTGRSLPSPSLIGTEGELSQALVSLYQKDGAPSLREMQRRAGKEWLALSSASRIVNRQALPTTPAQMEAFLRACSVPEKQHKPWLDAWNRVVGPGRFVVTRTERLEKWRLLRNSVVHQDPRTFTEIVHSIPGTSQSERATPGAMWDRLLYESFVTLDHEVFGKHLRATIS